MEKESKEILTDEEYANTDLRIGWGERLGYGLEYLTARYGPLLAASGPAPEK